MGLGTLQGGVRTPVGKLPLRRPRPSGLQHPACPPACSLWGEWVVAVFGADFGSVAAHSDGRVWPAEVGLSLALCSGVSAESLDVLTEKTSEYLVHSFRVRKVRNSN